MDLLLEIWLLPVQLLSLSMDLLSRHCSQCTPEVTCIACTTKNTICTSVDDISQADSRAADVGPLELNLH